jgi:hypothetical protein
MTIAIPIVFRFPAVIIILVLVVLPFPPVIIVVMAIIRVHPVLFLMLVVPAIRLVIFDPEFYAVIVVNMDIPGQDLGANPAAVIKIVIIPGIDMEIERNGRVVIVIVIVWISIPIGRCMGWRSFARGCIDTAGHTSDRQQNHRKNDGLQSLRMVHRVSPSAENICALIFWLL